MSYLSSLPLSRVQVTCTTVVEACRAQANDPGRATLEV